MYSGEDGKGDDWCAIRLTIDGDLMGTKPNFKIDGKHVKKAFSIESSAKNVVLNNMAYISFSP